MYTHHTHTHQEESKPEAPLSTLFKLPSISRTLSSTDLQCRRTRENKHIPDKRVLFIIHPGLKFQAGVLSKGWHDQAEHQGNANKDSRQNDLSTGIGRGRNHRIKKQSEIDTAVRGTGKAHGWIPPMYFWQLGGKGAWKLSLFLLSIS